MNIQSSTYKICVDRLSRVLTTRPAKLSVQSCFYSLFTSSLHFDYRLSICVMCQCEGLGQRTCAQQAGVECCSGAGGVAEKPSARSTTVNLRSG